VLSKFYEETESKSQYKKHKIEQFEPGTYSIYELSTKVSARWYIENENIKYHTTGFHTNFRNNPNIYDLDVVINDVQHYLVTAIEKRCCTTERPIACLLSGGLDSSLITALVNEYHKKHNLPQIETYSIGLEGSVDLKYAKIVADHLGTKHTEIILSEQDFGSQ
jgi:asparagine synthase (glutamine-hydrolysing)